MRHSISGYKWWQTKDKLQSLYNLNCAAFINTTICILVPCQVAAARALEKSSVDSFKINIKSHKRATFCVCVCVCCQHSSLRNDSNFNFSECISSAVIKISNLSWVVCARRELYGLKLITDFYLLVLLSFAVVFGRLNVILYARMGGILHFFH